MMTNISTRLPLAIRSGLVFLLLAVVGQVAFLTQDARATEIDPGAYYGTSGAWTKDTTANKAASWGYTQAFLLGGDNPYGGDPQPTSSLDCSSSGDVNDQPIVSIFASVAANAAIGSDSESSQKYYGLNYKDFLEKADVLFQYLGVVGGRENPCSEVADFIKNTAKLTLKTCEGSGFEQQCAGGGKRAEQTSAILAGCSAHWNDELSTGLDSTASKAFFKDLLYKLSAADFNKLVNSLGGNLDRDSLSNTRCMNAYKDLKIAEKAKALVNQKLKELCKDNAEGLKKIKESSDDERFSLFSGASSCDDIVNPDGGDGEDSASTCSIDGIGWIVCPVITFMSKVVDETYVVVENFLVVEPLSTNTSNSALYSAWDAMRNIANVLFVIAFLIIIYSQITGAGVSNYGIKKLLPRIIIAAILVNVSFWICAIAVDLSNIIGTSVKDLFDGIGANLKTPDRGNFATGEGGWQGITGVILAGVAVGSALFIGLPALIIFLPTALLAIVTAFLVLTLRQALIIILIAVAPLAFVAYLLPNTEGWFKKWFGLFQTMLMMFPIIAVIFGGSALASQIIMTSSDDISVQLMGAAVAIIPLAITPVIMKAAGGILNKFGAFVNNPNRGPFDALKKRAEATAGRIRNNRDIRAVNNSGMGRGSVFRRRRIASGQKLEAIQKQRDAAVDSFGNTNTGVRKYRSRAIDAQETAKATGAELENEVKKKHLEANIDLHGRVITTGLNLKNAEETHRNETEAGHMRQNPTQYQSLKGSQSDKQNAGLEVDRNFERSMLGQAYAQQRQGLEGQVDTAKQKQKEDYLNSTKGGVIEQQRKVATAGVKYAEGNRDLDYEKSIEGQAYAAARGEQEGELEIQRGDNKEIWEGSVEGQAQAVRKDAVQKQAKVTESRVENRAIEENADVRAAAQATSDTAAASQAEFDAILNQSRTTAGAAKLGNQRNPIVQELQEADAKKREQVDKGKAAELQAEQDYKTSKEGRQNAIDLDAAQTGIKVAGQKNEKAALEANQNDNLEAAAAQASLDAKKAEETALIEELKTKDGAAERLVTNPEYSQVAADLNLASTESRVETQRAGAAKRKADVEYAQDVKDDKTGLATRAGGIEGEAGISQARAVAQQTIIDSFKKGVAAEATLLASTKEDAILSDTMLGSPDILDQPDEKISAMGSTIAKRQHMESHIKLWERMGELQQQVKDETTAAEALTDPAAKAAALEKMKGRKDKLVNLQQQVMGDKSKKPFGIGDKDQGDATVGEYDNNIYNSTKERILSHLNDGSLSSMDPDDMRLIFEMARDGKLDPEHIRKIQESYEAWENNPNLKHLLKDKSRALLEPIVYDDYSAAPKGSEFNLSSMAP